MYIPAAHQETRLDVLHALMRAHPLGTWVMPGGGELVANHVPFQLDASRGEFGTLVAHVARANPVWQSAPAAVPGLVVFQGPQAYITPSWYPGKHAHGRAVPTWNYAVVHAHGPARFIEDKAWLREHLDTLTATHEAAEALPWKVDDAPPDFIDRLLGLIVGVEIPIHRLEGKWKTSQNRPEADQLGVVAGLCGRGDEASAAMAAMIRSFVGWP